MRIPSNLQELRDVLTQEGTTVTLLESTLRGRTVAHNLPLNRELHVQELGKHLKAPTAHDGFVRFVSSATRPLVLTLGDDSFWAFRSDTVNPDAVIATKQRPGGDLCAVFRIENVQQLADFDPRDEPDHERTNAVQDAWADEG